MPHNEALHLAETSEAYTESSFEELAEFMDTPEVIAAANQQVAIFLAQEAQKNLYGIETVTDLPETHPVVLPLSETIFSRLYDPDRPTLAVDYHASFCGADLIGIAAHESDRANVVYIASGVQYGEVAAAQDGSKQLWATRGTLINEYGETFCGDFPVPIPISIVESCNPDLLEEYEALGVPTLNSRAAVRAFGSKEETPQLCAGTSVSAPRHLDISEISEVSNGYVIKPATSSQGRGVRIFEADSDTSQALAYFQFLKDHDYQPVIQERVHSLPLYDPRTQQRLDWTVRALIADGAVAGMYARVDTWGDAVNISRNAQAYEIADLVRFGLNATQVEQIQQVLTQAAEEISQAASTSMAGLDLMVDESLQVSLIEGNIAATGGLQTIAQLAKTRQAKLAGSHILLEQWTPKLRRPAKQPIVERQAITPAPSARFLTAHYFKDCDIVDRLPLEEVKSHVVQPVQAAFWAANACSALRISRIGDPQNLEDAVIGDYPLEILPHLPRMALFAPSSKSLTEQCRQLAEITGDTIPYRTLLACNAARVGDLSEARHVITELPAKAAGKAQLLAELYFRLGSRQNDGLASPKPHVLRYLAEGYAPAMEVLEATINTSQQQEATPLQALRCSLAIGERHYRTAAQHLQSFIKSDADAYFDYCNDILGTYNHRAAESLDSLQFFNGMLADGDQTVQPVINIFSALRAGTITDADAVFAGSQLAHYIDYEASQEETTRFGLYLWDYQQYLNDPSHHWPKPSNSGWPTKLSTLADLLWRSEHNELHEIPWEFVAGSQGLHDIGMLVDIGRISDMLQQEQ